MTNATLRGKPDAGNPHVRFDEGEVASAKPRRGSLLYNVYHLSNPLPNLPHPPTIINMKIGRDGVYVATTVMSIPDFVSTLTQPMRMMYNGLRRGIPPGRIAAYMGFPGDEAKFKAHLRQFLTVFARYWGRSYGEFVFVL